MIKMLTNNLLLLQFATRCKSCYLIIEFIFCRALEHTNCRLEWIGKKYLIIIAEASKCNFIFLSRRYDPISAWMTDMTSRKKKKLFVTSQVWISIKNISSLSYLSTLALNNRGNVKRSIVYIHGRIKYSFRINVRMSQNNWWQFSRKVWIVFVHFASNLVVP